MIRASRARYGGALRDRHERWARDAVDVSGRSAHGAQTNDLDTDAEVVWS